MCAVLVGCGDSDETRKKSSPSVSSSAQVSPSAPRAPAMFDTTLEAEVKAAGFNFSDFRKGKRLYKLYCTACHQLDRPVAAGDLAPSAYAVAYHYRKAHPNVASRISALSSFVLNPDKTSVLMPGAVEKYGLMNGINLPQEQIDAVSLFLGTAEIKPVTPYDGHYGALTE